MFSDQKIIAPFNEMPQELLWTLSADGVITSLSTHAAEITGWRQSDCRGKPFRFFLHPKEISRIESCYPDLLLGKTQDLEEFRCLARNGFHRALSVSMVPRNQNGIVTEIFVLGNLLTADSSSLPSAPKNVFAFSSVSKRKTDQATTLESTGMAKLLESLLANAPVGFALLDEELHFVCLNQTFASMTGFSPEQQLGLGFGELLPGSQVLEELLKEILLSGSSVLEHEVILQKGAVAELSRFALMNFYPIPDDQGRTCGIAAIAVEITDRKRADQKAKKASEELARSNEALEIFCRTVSHDLNEPLRTIASHVKLLGRKYKGTSDEEADGSIQYALQGTQHMRYLIDGLLNYAKAGHSEIQIVKVDSAEIVQNVVTDLKVLIEESRTTVTFEPLPTVLGDRLLLLQIFQNLISNAIKFRGASPCCVNITSERRPTQWVFSVSDNGIGINPKYLPSIFAPFKRLHSQSKYPGAGLGLAISQKNVERLGGRIWATSEEGKGSTFSFSLPIETGSKI